MSVASRTLDGLRARLTRCQLDADSLREESDRLRLEADEIERLLVEWAPRT